MEFKSASVAIFPIAFRSPAAAAPTYRPDIDGLRAIAVLAVCFYHANFKAFGGGYVGVDVFFVISGFLIASLISSEIARGTFSLISFYERRIRRIFPALFNLALWSFLIALILLNPNDLLDFGKSLAAMTAFVSNLFFGQQADTGGYFGGVSSRQPLLHTWSLSVEEQFYIFFPVMMVALHRWIGKWQTFFLLCVFTASLIFSFLSTASNATTAFFFLAPRVWEFMCGALLATAAVPPLKLRVVRELTGIFGLALICYAITVFDKYTAFPGLNALFPCIGTALLIHAGTGGPSHIKTLLSLPPLVFVGVISYSLYLWHWPIFVFAKLFLVRNLDDPETAIALACALLAAFLSFELVEIPFRRKPSSVGRRQIFGFGAVAAITGVCMGGALIGTGGLPQRYDIKTREIVFRNLERATDTFYECGNWKTEIHKISDIRFCEFGRSESNNVMFWGDSYLGTFGSMIKETRSEGNLPGGGAILAIEPGCPVVPNLNWSQAGLHCDQFNEFALRRAHADDIGTVFFIFSTWWLRSSVMCLTVEGRCTRKLPLTEATQYLMNGLSSTIRELRASGKRVIVTLPFPLYFRSIPDIEIRNAVFAGMFGKIVLTDFPLGDLRDQFISMARDAGADVFDPRASLCGDHGCIYQVDGVSIYQNNDHLAASQAGILKTDLIKILSGQQRAEQTRSNIK